MKNRIPVHPLQSFEWGEFRKKTGAKVVKGDNFQLTIHKIPLTSFTLGYLPKGPMPTKKAVHELRKIGRKENCIFIQVEPNIPMLTLEESPGNKFLENLGLRPSAHPLFTKYTFQLDLTKNEEELLKNMHPKTRYNIRLAQRHGVKVVEDNSEKAFNTYIKLLKETIKRQKFYAHDERYHRLMWQTLRPPGIAHLLIARYKNQPLVAWILFIYKDVLYYPYGASSEKHKEAMASNLAMWEVIRFGKKMGCHTFDMWGSLGPKPDKNDTWFGFHRFKEGYGGRLVEFIGSYDLVISPFLYELYKLADKLRWLFLKARAL